MPSTQTFPPREAETVLDFDEEQKSITLTVVDVLGKEIRKINFSGKQFVLNKEKMKPGLYFIRVTDRVTTIKKIVLQ